MNKPSVLVVEDEPLVADDIAQTLEKHGYHVVGIADEADEAFELIQSESPDIALLDINIEGDKDGIHIAEKLEIPFVFLTSYYDKNTLDRAKRTNPSGYIVKPFSEKDLIANLEMALHNKRPKDGIRKPPEKLFVRKDQEIISVLSSDIIYVEAFDNYANVYTAHEKYIISHTLKSIEEKLIPLGFERIHRSYLINFQAIDSISEGLVFLKGYKVSIGQSFRKDFFRKLSML